MAPKKLVVSNKPVVHQATESLLATDAEKHATSQSLYGDHKARISSNVSALHDRMRISAYKNILSSLKGKTVLHLGCGMGLISMMAARAKAQHVVAVDSSAIVDCARVVAEQNKLTNVSFFRGAIKDVASSFPIAKFDVILCEWMGAFLTNEDDYENILYCRENLLAPGGIICPDKSTIHVVGVMDYQYRRDTVDYWDNVYGFRMHPMKALVLEEASTCAIPRHCILTAPARGHTVDIMNAPREGRSYSFPFRIVADRRGTVHFITFFVDAMFANPTDQGANFALSINPGGANAWTEVSVSLEEAIPVMKGDAISGTVTVAPQSKVTEVTVEAACEGAVVNVKTSGKYFYTY